MNSNEDDFPWFILHFLEGSERKTENIIEFVYMCN